MDRIRNLIDKFTEEMATDPSEVVAALKVVNREEVDKAYADYVAARLEGGCHDAPWFIQQTKMFVHALLLVITSHPDQFGDTRALRHSLELTKIAFDTFEFRPVRAIGKPAGYQEMVGTNLSMTPKQAEELEASISKEMTDDTAQVNNTVCRLASLSVDDLHEQLRKELAT
jgi:hypothetical protein